MASRIPQQFSFDYCYSPIPISRNGLIKYVQCGKCNGCLLHSSNEWSQRLSLEIDSNPSSIFATFTYNNRYVPKFTIVTNFRNGWNRCFSADGNIRFDGSKDVLRRDFEYFDTKEFIFNPPKNYHNPFVVAYSSKRDFQLYLKILRKYLDEHFNNNICFTYDSKRFNGNFFRYYAVSEYGPNQDPAHGSYRPHIHTVFFPCNSEVAEFMLNDALYSCWQMCDKGLFYQHLSYCNSGVSTYLTNYVTCTTDLPKIYAEDPIKTWRLASKKPSIGFGCFDKEKISKDFQRGTFEYTRTVRKLGQSYVLPYPKKITDTLFPKCSRYDLLDFDGLLRVYSYLYKLKRLGYSSVTLSRRLRGFKSQDEICARRCLEYCETNHCSPVFYVLQLVRFHMYRSQKLLLKQYQVQNELFREKPYMALAWYSNIIDLFDDCLITYQFHVLTHSDFQKTFRSLYSVLSSFGIVDFSYDNLKFIKSKVMECYNNSLYMSEVDDIVYNMDKAHKKNAISGSSPHIV